MTSIHERRMRILQRMSADPQSALLLARARSAATVPAGARSVTPAGGGPTHDMVVGRVSRAASQMALTTGISGRLVRAEEANLNGAYFATDDLQFGLDSLAGAPLTWNHDSAAGAYGWIEEANLLSDPAFGPHINITGRVWTARFPGIAASLEETLAANVASLSMECIAQSVQCMEAGCGTEVTGASAAEDVCAHIAERTGVRRMVKPTFYGAALILDGVKPGWPGASLSVA